jgi:peptidyl-prolyl cis-trans isomerase SurA
MPRRFVFVLLVAACVSYAVIIDRIAVVVGNAIIKDSDIDRDIRVTSLLNGQPVDLSQAKRKDAVTHLIDQVFIRNEIEVGSYAVATFQDADAQLDRLVKQRFRTQAAFQQALRQYGLTELDLRSQFKWQLTVLKFIDARFKPAVLISDDEIEKYYRQHAAALQRQYSGKSLDDLREQIRDILTAEAVNQQFFAWLDDQRKNTKIQYLEASLK